MAVKEQERVMFLRMFSYKKTISKHTWQSRVENKHYSVVYFNRGTVFKALFKCGAHMCCVNASICEASTL